VIAASSDAQALLLAAKHLGKDPYELWHLGMRQRGRLPSHPRPMVYRAFLLAGGDWLEERERERMLGVFADIASAVLGSGKEEKKKRPKGSKRGRPATAARKSRHR
jgi:hypothetical protein